MTGISFGDLTDDDKRRLLSEYNAGTIDYSQFSAQPDSVRRMLQRWRDGGRRTRKAPPPDLPLMDTQTRQEKDAAAYDDWLSYLEGMKQRQRRTVVCHPSDLHLPYNDPQAEYLAYNIIEHSQPDIVVIGSDAFDMPHLSSFPLNPDVTSDIDVMYEFERLWNPHIHALHNVAPDAELVYIWGNHERRFLRHIKEKAKEYRHKLYEDYIRIIESGGRVRYIGKRDRVHIGNTIVMHGNRHGQYVAKALLNDVLFQSSIMAGHNHRKNVWTPRGSLYSVEGNVAGCLCSLEPHYVEASEVRGQWQHGTCVGDIDLHGNLNNFQNLEFHPHGDGLITWMGFTSITS